MAIGTVDGEPRCSSATTAASTAARSTASVNANGNATDWKSLNDGTIDALQYYSVGVGKLADDGSARPRPAISVLVSGGLQDNGGSLLRPARAKMGSNFGGDGGDVLVDPTNGCNIVQEYVYLSIEVTQTCAQPGRRTERVPRPDRSRRRSNIAPPDINARFIAPFTANDKNINKWIAGGTSIWYQNKGFAIRPAPSGRRSTPSPTPAQTHGGRLLGRHGSRGLVRPVLNNGGFARGAAVGTSTGTDVDGHRSTCRSAARPEPVRCRALRSTRTTRTHVPRHQRLLAPLHRGPGRRRRPRLRVERRRADLDGHRSAGTSRTSRRTTSWSCRTTSLVVGTDLGVVYRARRPDAVDAARRQASRRRPSWTVGSAPTATCTSATHGRGIWRIALPAGSLTPPAVEATTQTSSTEHGAGNGGQP